MDSLNTVIKCLVAALLLQTPFTIAGGYELETVAEGFDYPWCVAFLPNGDYLLSMRSGELRIVSSSGDIGDAIEGVPEAYVESQGGFFDVALDPNFTDNQTVYLAFAHGDIKSNTTRIVRANLSGQSLHNVEPIFTTSPSKKGPAHYGGKLQFLSDGTLLLTTGDGFDYREAAQDTFSHLGKIIRINTDGSVPSDNPFADGKKGDAKVWSYGHRSPQGLVLDLATERVFMHEHGPMGGDELNLAQAGKNYGWPAVTYGINYSGALVSPFTEADGMQQPLRYWVPSNAPSGLAYYKGDAFPDWNNSLLMGTLVDNDVKRLQLDGAKVVAEESLFAELNARIRDVRVGPDGLVYLLTDSEQGKLIRVKPAS